MRYRGTTPKLLTSRTWTPSKKKKHPRTQKSTSSKHLKVGVWNGAWLRDLFGSDSEDERDEVMEIQISTPERQELDAI